MTEKTNINKLFTDTLTKSDIKHVVVDGFDKYIIYNDEGTLFVVGFNKEINKYGFGRTPLMLAEYKHANIPTDILPNYQLLYAHIGRIYQVYKEAKPLFDLIDRFSGKKR